MLPLYISDVPLHCINEAAYEYRVPAKLIVSILNVERGKVGITVRNKNGTYDLGPMQINTSWWPSLYAHGITKHEVLYNACTNVKVGAWILGKFIASENTLLSGVGDYNSHTPIFNKAYAQRIRVAYTKLILSLQK